MDEVMLLLIIAVVICIGPVLGSFYAAQVMRGEKLTQASGKRSLCDHCGHTLSWLDLVPLLSFIFLRGKCRYCGKPIDNRIFISELLGLIYFGLLGVGTWQIWDAGETELVHLLIFGAIFFVLLCLFYYLSVFDLLTYSIPTVAVQVLLSLAILLNLFFLAVRLWQPALLPLVQLGYLDNLISGLVAGGVTWLIVRLTGEKGMGMGDVFLAVIMGILLGWPEILASFYVMLFSALLAGLLYAYRQKKFKGTRIPLVPFMTLGFIVALVWGEQIFTLLFPLV